MQPEQKQARFDAAPARDMPTHGCDAHPLKMDEVAWLAHRAQARLASLNSGVLLAP